MGQGKEKCRDILKQNPELATELEDRIMRELKVGPYANAKDLDEDTDEDQPIGLAPSFDDAPENTSGEDD